MTIMNYNEFKNILNNSIFEKSKSDLLEKIAKKPNRYIGLFRPTKPKGKVLQNLLQSQEIRFGDALEKIIENYFKLKGCRVLNKKYTDTYGKKLNIDLCFEYQNKIYFIELKVRDDHDSTKKRGQLQNYEKKLYAVISKYGEDNVIGIFYFVDPDLIKNKNFYNEELNKMTNSYNVKNYIFYGKELFTFLGFEDIWFEIIKYLEEWKKEVPDLPEVNFDLDANNTFNEIKNLEPSIFRKLFENEDIFKNIIPVLFPEQKTLSLLKDYFEEQERSIYKNLAKTLSLKLQKK